jgi:hypothetical protein
MGVPSKPDSSGAGAGNHMAAVIRRIEGFYCAPTFDDSDDDEASRGADGNDSRGVGGAGGGSVGDADSASEGEDDASEPCDPNDLAAVAAAAAKRAAKAAAKATAKAGKKRPAAAIEEWYDMEDDFIDDDELDEYFERNGAAPVLMTKRLTAAGPEP